MGILTLATGDPAALRLLKAALAARYGVRPLAFDGLRLLLTTQRRLWGLPVSVSVETAFQGVDHWLWMESARFLGFLPFGGRAESYDGAACYVMRRGVVTSSSEPPLMEITSRRLWALRAVLLTPLSEEGITLKSTGERAFRAYSSQSPETAVTVTLNEDNTLQRVETPLVFPTQAEGSGSAVLGTPLTYVIRLEGPLQTLSNVVLPTNLVIGWGNQPDETHTRYTIAAMEANPIIPENAFTLGSQLVPLSAPKRR